MADTRLPETDADPVSLRLQRIVEAKRADNEAILGELDRLDADWTKLNKDVDGVIDAEFDAMELEGQAADDAVRDLEQQRAAPVPGGFVLAGKILESREKVGLPGMLLQVAARVRDQPVTLGEARTDALGSFSLTFESKLLGTLGEGSHEFSFSVFSAPGVLVHGEDQTVTVRAGRVQHVVLTLRQVTDLSDRIAAGKSVRDSVRDNASVVAGRLDNMRSAHTAVTELALRTRAELKTLREQLSAAPPILGSPKPRKSRRPKRRSTAAGDAADRPDSSG